MRNSALSNIISMTMIIGIISSFITNVMAEENTVYKPNIIYIMVDDLGKEWISCYGAEDIQTPNIDALAATGMKFNNAYSMPACTPSRTTLLTGKYPFRTGYVNHWDVPRWGIGYFDWKQKENTTFARLMKEQGYATFATGKWQLNDFRLEPLAMQKHGFDDWAMWTGCETSKDKQHEKKSTQRYWNAHINTKEGSKTYEGKFGPDIYTDHLIKFMRQHKDKPMCLYYPMVLPHTPVAATPDEPKAKGVLGKHKAMVRYIDKMVGKLVKELDDLGIRDRTIIILTTDNGSAPPPRGVIGTRNGRKIVGAKSTETEAGVNAPFIVNCPGLVPAGVETDALTDFTDILPSFVELGGGEVPKDLIIDGSSFAPLILGEKQDSDRKWIMALGYGSATLDDKGVRGAKDFSTRVIRDKRYKVWISNERQIIRLHDLKKDPWEENNLITIDKPEHKKALEKFQSVLDSLPEKDARPLYEARAANPWDRNLIKRKKKK
ncbi:sulfatase-like hydrolase/transferase [Lentisphaera marina]|uniref:sulfatase-like hydrolase/transferase n=1 Tax=Lentisphaera marina TaxID=1111041 RepID=UPI002365ED76|nr:sulfatase-like hydrolase/transferase [Lentisphaera marina]MDD7983546.1 sulfatase-like hydrolase/transferase [Lentisphaera marina]